MKYKIELVAKTENYSVIDENDKEFQLELTQFENMGWENIEIRDEEINTIISDSDIGKEIIKQFKTKEDKYVK